MLEQRQQQLAEWASQSLSIEPPKLDVVSGDASFRRYFRFKNNGQSIIAVDAPPEHENNHAFHQVAKLLREANVNVPEFFHVNFEKGFLLLSDLGDRLFLPELNTETVDNYYSKAIHALIQMQQISLTKLGSLPHYDRKKLLSEMMLFKDWFIQRHLNLVLSDAEDQMINKVFEQLITSALLQPQTFVHRDYHSRNLMICESQTPGVIDFQDAVVGPISYDLVSLIKDCYIQWPQAKVENWAKEFFDIAKAKGLLSNDFESFTQQLDWMGMQRHLKVLGIFCRLHYRDGKSSYLTDLPLTFQYLQEAVQRYPEFDSFNRFLISKILPAMKAAS